MWRNYLTAALRNLMRNRLYAAIGIFSLTMGICAAILSGLVIRNQTTHDQFIDGYERTYLAAIAVVPMGRAPEYSHPTPSFIAEMLKSRFPQIESTARLNLQEVSLRHGKIEAAEKIYWTDSSVFDVLRLPVFVGDTSAALRRPDGIVVTRDIARKYFGRDDPRGQTLEIDGQHSMTITAVLEDLPLNATQLETGIFASGLAPFSTLYADDHNPRNHPGGMSVSLSGRTYLRLAPHASIEPMRHSMPQWVEELWPTKNRPPGLKVIVEFIRLDKVHLFAGLNPGIEGRLAALGAIGLLILAIACVVFVNLLTARSARRAMEVAVRKSVGASRRALMSQFLGESLLYVFIATCIALALVELLLPYVNAFLNSGATLDYRGEPALLLWLGSGVILLSVIAGAYPAVVLSASSPADVLRGSRNQVGGSVARHGLVTLQFAILIALIVAAAITHLQRTYATNEALRVDTDRMLIVRSGCHEGFVQAVKSLPGVRGAQCSGDSLLTAANFGNFRLRNGGMQAIDMVDLEFGTFDLYGVKPLAGKIVSTQGFVINETAARSFGFEFPATAIGQSIPIAEGGHRKLQPDAPNEIVAVVPDFSIETIRHRIRSTIYHVEPEPRFYGLINIKLAGHDIPETLAAIDRLWTQMGLRPPASVYNRSDAANARQSIDRFFLDDYLQNLYLSLLRETQVFSLFCALAIVLACLGLAGLTAATAEQRTKEVGIRKAMGADSHDIMRLLLWQFTRPVLWANLIAWPVSYYFMQRWLEGFAYHVDLKPQLFVIAGAAALAIALLTVGAHSFLIGRAKPIEALRHE